MNSRTGFPRLASCNDSNSQQSKRAPGKRLGLLVAVFALVSCVIFSSCSSQSGGPSGSGASGNNALNSTGVTATLVGAHDVLLNWNPSASGGVLGYNIYRSLVSGGPYTRINPSAVPATSYTDDGVASGQTYYYVVTATTNAQIESVYSNEVTAPIP